MSSQWATGTVALVNGDICLRMSDGWEHGRDDSFRYHDKQALDIRPLVVIDPEDREQVERLCRRYTEAYSERTGTPWSPTYEKATTDMQAALRELANPTPPKPEEPTGLGAVVTAAAYTEKVRTFVRCSPHKSAWMDEDGNGHDWSELDVTEVLSEGVTL